MKVKEGIPTLFTRNFLDIANWAFQSALINLREIEVDGKMIEVHVSSEDAIRRFQKFLNLDEDHLDTDALKSSYYRNQRRFIDAMQSDLKCLRIEYEPSRQEAREWIEESVISALEDLLSQGMKEEIVLKVKSELGIKKRS